MLLLSLSLRKLPLVSPSFLLNKPRIRRTTSPLRAVEKESEFELDRDKARQALQKLDQQLQNLSQKEITQPKTRIPTPKLDAFLEADRTRNMMREEMPEFSGSYLAYSAFALLALTIFYNIVFITIIKPSVDGT